MAALTECRTMSQVEFGPDQVTASVSTTCPHHRENLVIAQIGGEHKLHPNSPTKDHSCCSTDKTCDMCFVAINAQQITEQESQRTVKNYAVAITYVSIAPQRLHRPPILLIA